MSYKVKLIFLSVSLTGAMFLTGILITVAQESVNNKQADLETLEKKALTLDDPQSLASAIKWFQKVTDDGKLIDDGNKIITIRKVNLVFDDIDEKKFTFKNKRMIIEIEVYSKIRIPTTNNAQFALIGEKAIPEPGKSADGHTFFIHLEPKEFMELKDQALITYSIGLPPVSSNNEETNKAIKNKAVVGAKFGVISKKPIDQLPVIEEDEASQLLRISQTTN